MLANDNGVFSIANTSPYQYSITLLLPVPDAISVRRGSANRSRNVTLKLIVAIPVCHVLGLRGERLALS